MSSFRPGMSYRPSDAYSRRPPHDDRRAPDSLEPRRDASKGTFDAYKNDRYRKDADTSLRDRRNPPESPRGPPSANSARPNASVCSAPSGHGNGELSTSQSPAGSPGLDRGSASDKLFRLIRTSRDATIDIARLRAERDPLEKALRQRQAEHERSMKRHADFPSIPEVQNMHRIKYAKQVQDLDAQIQQAQAEANKAGESIIQIMSGLLSDPGNKTATPAGSLQQQEASKKQQAEIGELKSQIQQMKSQHLQEQSELKSKIARHSKEVQEMKRQMEEMMKEMKKGMKEVKTMQGMKREVREDVAEEVKEQLRKMRGEFIKRQTEQELSQQNDWGSRLSKQEDELKRLQEHTSSSERASSAEVSTMIQQESSAVRSDMAGLREKVDELVGRLAQYGQDAVSLRDELATWNRKLESQAEKVDEHESKLSNIDFDILDRAAETISFGVPDLQRKVDGLQSSISQETEDKIKAMSGQIQTLVAKMGDAAGEMVDRLQKSIQDYGSRIEALEEASAMRRLQDAVADGQAARVEPGSFSSEVESIKTDYDATKTKVETLVQGYQGLSTQVGQVTQTVTTSSKDLNEQLECLRHLVTVLDSQFNNLSTRSLADLIIGQLEQLYPDVRRLIADLDGLKMLAEGFEARVGNLEAQVQDYAAKVDRLEERAASLVWGNQNPVKPMLDDCRPGSDGDGDDHASNGHGHKRRKIDASPNGAEHLITNGSD